MARLHRPNVAVPGWTLLLLLLAGGMATLFFWNLPSRSMSDEVRVTPPPPGIVERPPTAEQAPRRSAVLPSGQVIEGDDFRILSFDEVLAEGGVASAMEVAIEQYPERLRALLADGTFDPNMPLPYDQGRNWSTPIEEAMRQGSEETFAILMAAGADPDRPNGDGENALHWAAYQGLMGAIEQFLAAGADPSSIAEDGSTPLRKAAFGGHLDVVERLLEAGADAEHSALWAAAAGGHDDIVRRLAAAGASPAGTPGERGIMCPIWQAAYGGHTETVRLLLQLGAPPTCESGNRPIDIARANGHSEIVALLERAGES